MSAMRSFSRGVLMTGALMLPVAADFVPPAEGPVPFRRDKLPVDVDTMTALSRQVTMFTGARKADDPDELRAVAQMTALALALDPANRTAKELIESLKAGKTPESVPEDELERARARAWQVLGWLEMPEAGPDGQALAACLNDVLVMGDPHHPKARERRSAGEKGAWKDWVAEEAAFRPKELAKELPTEEPEPAPVDEEKKQVSLMINELSVAMPFWHYDKTIQQMKLELIPIGLKGSIHKADDGEGEGEGDEDRRLGFQIEIPGEGMTDQFAKAMRPVEAAITRRHGSLPEGLQVKLGFGKIDYSLSRNGMALTGTTALLLDGALTGKVPAAVTLAVVGEDGKLALPPRFWQTLRAISPLPDGSRLILPDEAAEFLTALVVMEDAAFFMKHEVLLAGTVDELCDQASPSPEGKIADGLRRFEEIRKAGEDKALGTFVAHPATQQRLRDLAALMPEHASARMLALQGSGNRPRFLQRSILAREIRSALEPVGFFAISEPDDLDPEKLESAHEASREQLGGLVAYIDIRDRDLHKSAVDVADSLRTLARLLPKKDPENSTGIQQKQAEAYHAASVGYRKIMRELTLAAGDLEDYPLPTAEKGD